MTVSLIKKPNKQPFAISGLAKGKAWVTEIERSKIEKEIPVPPKPSTSSSKKSKTTTLETDVPSAKSDYEAVIFRIDNAIQEFLSNRKKDIAVLSNSLSELCWVMENSPDPVDRMAAKTEITALRNNLRDIELGFDVTFYMVRSEQILQRYKEITTATSNCSFFRGSKSFTQPKKSTKDEMEKEKLIGTFMAISEEYIDYDKKKGKTSRRTTTSKEVMTCNVCGNKEMDINEDDLTARCQCGNIMEMLDDTPAFRDTERINMSSRYTYTCRGHFIEAMNCFEGKQNVVISKDVIEMIKHEIQVHDLKNPTKNHIYMFLSENKMSEHYANINLIYYLVTGISPPDITTYRLELLDMHDQVEDAYAAVKNTDRLNSLNVNWKLYKLLQLLDYPCKKDDFFCLRTLAKQIEHEDKWVEMVEYLAKTYPTSKTSKGKSKWRIIRSL